MVESYLKIVLLNDCNLDGWYEMEAGFKNNIISWESTDLKERN
jgi:hypothetical protein